MIFTATKRINKVLLYKFRFRNNNKLINNNNLTGGDNFLYIFKDIFPYFFMFNILFIILSRIYCIEIKNMNKKKIK